MSTPHHPTSRRNIMRLAGMAGAVAVATIGSETKAMASPNVMGSFAPAPTGGDDSNIIKDAIAYGKILGPGTYKIYNANSISQGSLIGIPTKTCLEVHCPTAFSDSGPYNGLYVDGINFECDPAVVKSVFVNTYTGGDVMRHKTIRNCFFHNYSGAAISWNQNDNPYLKLDNCQFWGANTPTSMAVAMATAGDETLISNCDFIEYQHALFLGQAANRVRIRDCEFLHYGNPIVNPVTGKTMPRVDIWVEPHNGIANSGCGMIISDNKFGNENRKQGDLFVLYADRGVAFDSTSQQAGNWLPKYSASTGIISLSAIQNNDFSGGEGVSAPITSYTPNLVGCNFGPNAHSGSMGAVEVNFAANLPTQNQRTRIDTGFAWSSTSIKPTNANTSLFRVVS